jgi:hypothetical protein
VNTKTSFLYICRYRKIASNKCVGGVENSGKYRLLNVSCPVYRPEGLSLHIERNVLPTKATGVFKLSQAKVTIRIISYPSNSSDHFLHDKMKTKIPHFWNRSKIQLKMHKHFFPGFEQI